MKKKLWTIFPLLIVLVLLTAGSTLTVYVENDSTIDVALFKLNLPDDWSYNPDDISDYEHSCSLNLFPNDSSIFFCTSTSVFTQNPPEPLQKFTHI